MSEKIELPNKLSELGRLATSDARGLDRDLYSPASWDFHKANKDKTNKCSVCLAGAVISGTLGRSNEGNISILKMYDEDRSIARKLIAIDDLRTGNITNALHYLDVSIDREKLRRILNSVEVAKVKETSYFDGWISFEANLEAVDHLCDMLEREGL